jgi:hypothetical protein
MFKGLRVCTVDRLPVALHAQESAALELGLQQAQRSPRALSLETILEDLCMLLLYPATAQMGGGEELRLDGTLSRPRPRLRAANSHIGRGPFPGRRLPYARSAIQIAPTKQIGLRDYFSRLPERWIGTPIVYLESELSFRRGNAKAT